MNLWTLDLDDNKLEQITDHDYVYGYGFDGADQRIAYLPRKGKVAPYTTCLHVLTPSTGSDQQVLCDTPDLAFTWGRPRFSPDGDTVYFNAQIKGDRKRVQLVKVDLGKKRPKAVPITDVNATKVCMTFIDGEKVYDAESPPKLTAH